MVIVTGFTLDIGFIGYSKENTRIRYFIMNKKLHKQLLGVSSWYTTLADYTFPTTFVKLKESDLDLLANKVTFGEQVGSLITRIQKAQSAFSGSTFVFTDTVSPNDTPRFTSKKGAVHSAQSAWNNLTNSEKVRNAAKNREFECICVRPFRNMTYPREFRLFIYEGELKLMSQYWLNRAYHRLELKRDIYWTKAKAMVEEISWLLPSENIVLDIYFTSRDDILLLDFNSWGQPTKPLLAKSWDIDWNNESGIKIL